MFSSWLKIPRICSANATISLAFWAFAYNIRRNTLYKCSQVVGRQIRLFSAWQNQRICWSHRNQFSFYFNLTKDWPTFFEWNVSTHFHLICFSLNIKYIHWTPLTLLRVPSNVMGHFSRKVHLVFETFKVERTLMRIIAITLLMTFS